MIKIHPKLVFVYQKQAIKIVNIREKENNIYLDILYQGNVITVHGKRDIKIVKIFEILKG